VIVGAPKAATTYLHVLLRDHPDVFMPRGESPLFEDPFYNGHVRDELAQLFDKAPRGATLGLKCPTYLPNRECAPRIAELSPDAKIIVALRNPADRALADYFHKVRSGRLPYLDPNIGLMKIVSGEWNDANVTQVLEFGLYGRHLARYLEFFPRESIHIFVSDLARSPQPEYAEELFRFVGLNRVTTAADSPQSANVGIFNPRALKIIGALSRRRYTNTDSPWERRVGRDGPAGRVLDLAYGAAIRGMSEVATRWMDNKRPVLTAETRSSLCEYYREDVRALEALLGLDLSRWMSVTR
jgi:hypothetical protein